MRMPRTGGRLSRYSEETHATDAAAAAPSDRSHEHRLNGISLAAGVGQRRPTGTAAVRSTGCRDTQAVPPPPPLVSPCISATFQLQLLLTGGMSATLGHRSSTCSLLYVSMDLPARMTVVGLKISPSPRWRRNDTPRPSARFGHFRWPYGHSEEWV